MSSMDPFLPLLLFHFEILSCNTFQRRRTILEHHEYEREEPRKREG